ncbi:MAG: ROK family protein [Rectinemataceae bacterium]
MAEFIGIDLGGTKIRGVLTDHSGRVILAREVLTLASEGEEAIFSRIASITRDLAHGAPGDGMRPDVQAIGICAPGPLDSAKGRILVTENLPFIDFPLGPRLKELLGLPVFLDNDGAAAAMGEYLHGAGRSSVVGGRPADPLLYLTISTGIGAGAILGGRLFRGHSSNALEAGHMTLEPGGPTCACGNQGCAEVLASGTAISIAATAAAEAAREGSGPQTALSAWTQPGSREAFLAAAGGDRVAEAIVSEALGYLGICAANLATLFDPEVLIVGGGVTRAGPRVIEAIRAGVRERCPRVVAEGLRILPASLGDDSGALGAAALAALSLEGSSREAHSASRNAG